jgi:hypothetical protein
MKIFHSYHKADDHGPFKGTEFYTDKTVSEGDILFVVIGKKNKLGRTQYFLDGKFLVRSVVSNGSQGDFGKKKRKLLLSPLLRNTSPVLFSDEPSFDSQAYRNDFISTGGFREINERTISYVELFERLLPNVAVKSEAAETFFSSEIDLDRSVIDERVLRDVLARRGQPKFRNDLLNLYAKRCCITRCSVVELLEAAHIDQHSEGGDYSVTNGLLLRADIHTLFDLHLLTIDDHLLVQLSERLVGSEYETLQGKQMAVPGSAAAPNMEALRRHFEVFLSCEKVRKV